MSSDPYGSGPAFPFVRDGNGNFKVSSGKQLVEENVHNAVNVMLGERPMWKQFGNRAQRVLFSLEGDIRSNVVKEYFIKALEEVESRARIADVVVTSEGNEVKIEVTYEVLGFNDFNSLLIVRRLQ
jgi:phage baseplate assembly protein W